MKRIIVFVLVVFAGGIAHALELPGGGFAGIQQPRHFSISDAELRLTSDSTAELRFNLVATEGHHFYRDQIRVEVITPETVRLEKLVLPSGVKKYDPYLERELTLLKGTSSIVARLSLPSVELVKEQPLQISITYQGCSENTCFPYQVERLQLDFNEAGILEDEQQPDARQEAGLAKRYGVVSLPTVLFTDPDGTEYAGERVSGFIDAEEMTDIINRVVSGEGRRERGSAIEQLLGKRGTAVALLAYFVFGLLMSLTPCVWPMVPITAGIVLGSRKPGTFAGIMLAGSYVLGMAVSYAIMGLIVATAGGLIGGLLQHPAVLLLISGLFVAMALSMFGLYELPLMSLGGGKRGGGMLAAFGLGAGSALVLSPCVGPVLAGLLGFVALKGNQLLGTVMLFLYGLGMGLPLIVLGASSGALKKLPKAGGWMVEIKKMFGIVMLAFAVYFLPPQIGSAGIAVIGGIAAILLGIALLALDVRRNFAGFLPKVKTVLSVMLIVFGGYFAVTAVTGTARDAAKAETDSDETTTLVSDAAQLNESIQWYESFEEARAVAMRENKYMMIDFTADWCTYCKQLERETFSDPSVIEASRNMVAVRVDLTLSK